MPSGLTTPSKTELTFVLPNNDDTNHYSFKTGAWKQIDKDKIINESMTISEIESSILFTMRTSDCHQGAFVKKITVY